MASVSFGGTAFEVDEEGFLINPDEWDRSFAAGMALSVGIDGKLGDKHWAVIESIRRAFIELGRCPLLYETCRRNGLRFSELKELFPAGYQRGACKLAGVTYRSSQPKVVRRESRAPAEAPAEEKVYRIDLHGFLIDPGEWDEDYATHRALDLHLAEGLSERHWRVLYFLRRWYEQNGAIPTFAQTSEALDLDLDELAALFPDGYHRGAVRLAGLRFR